MKKYYHNKLVRDKIPEIIKANGDPAEVKVVSKSEIKKLLRKKLIEEAKEASSSNKGNLLNELSDVLQLIVSLGETEGISYKEIQKKRTSKEKKAGAYKKGMFLVWTNKPAGQK